MAVRVVVDSASDLPLDLAEQLNITVVPCYVVMGDRSYRDGLDMTADEFYARLSSEPRLPTTAQPSAADFQSVYRDLLDQGHHIVSVHISSKLSGTLSSAQQAQAALGEAGEGRIEIVDSQLASISQGLVAVSAARQAGGSDSHQQVAERIRMQLPLTATYFALDTLEYLQKGGRIGKAQAFVGSVLNVKPILTLRDGEAHPMERLRNRDRAIRRVVELTRQMAPLQQLAVIYSTEPERAETLLDQLSGLLLAEQVVTARFGPTLGTYVGPRALGVAFTRAGGELKS